MKRPNARAASNEWRAPESARRPTFARLFCFGLAFIAGITSVGKGLYHLATGEVTHELRETVGDGVGPVFYQETFDGLGLLVLAAAWIVIGASWIALGVFCWRKLAAADRGRELPARENRLLVGAAALLLIAGAGMLAPYWLGIRGS